MESKKIVRIKLVKRVAVAPPVVPPVVVAETPAINPNVAIVKFWKIFGSRIYQLRVVLCRQLLPT